MDIAEVNRRKKFRTIDVEFLSFLCKYDEKRTLQKYLAWSSSTRLDKSALIQHDLFLDITIGIENSHSWKNRVDFDCYVAGF